MIDEGELDVLFYSLRKINVGEQLLWDYRQKFQWCFKLHERLFLMFETNLK